jgi:hypothetical protein
MWRNWTSQAAVAIAAYEQMRPDPQDERADAIPDTREWTIQGDPPTVSDGPPIRPGWAVRVVPAAAPLWPDPQDERARVVDEIVARLRRPGGNPGLHPLHLAADLIERDTERLRALIDDLTDSDPCQYDHNDFCQAHHLHERPCPHERAKAWLAQFPGAQERRKYVVDWAENGDGILLDTRTDPATVIGTHDLPAPEHEAER